MLLLSENDFETLKELVEFIVLNWDKKQVMVTDLRELKRETYYSFFGKALGLAGGTIHNNFFSTQGKRQRMLNPKALKNLEKEYDLLKEKNKLERNTVLNDKLELFKSFKLILSKRVKENSITSQKEITSNSKKVSPIKKNKTSKLNDIIASFKNTIWYCYERHAIGQKIGIERKVIYFNESKDQVYQYSVSLYPSLESYSNWNGHAWFNEADKTLIMYMTSLGEGYDYSHFMIKIDTRNPEPTMLVGHKTFNNNDKNNIVTKVILLEKVPFEVDKKPTPKRFEKPDENELYLRIWNFLLKKEQNRLSTPHAVKISSKETFEMWYKQNEQHYISTSLSALEGTYELFYRLHPNDSEFKKDVIELSITETGSVKVLFFHTMDNSKSYEWEGFGFPNYETKTLGILLNGPLLQNPFGKYERLFDNKAIFLMIDLPATEITAIDTLSGLIAGARDNDNGCVARLMVICKIVSQTETRNKVDLTELNNFFDYYSNRSWVRPPASTSIYNFEHLKVARKATEELRNKNKKKD